MSLLTKGYFHLMVDLVLDTILDHTLRKDMDIPHKYIMDILPPVGILHLDILPMGDIHQPPIQVDIPQPVIQVTQVHIIQVIEPHRL